MQVQLFGVGIRSKSPAITAQSRVNCIVEPRQEGEKTRYVLLGRPGLLPFVSTLGSQPSRGLWPVNTLSSGPLAFSIHGDTLYSINNAGFPTAIGTIGTSNGDVSMADDGKYLVPVDGTNGYVYNMQTPGGLNQITDGNFTTTPKTVTWQDNYFIVTAGSGRQFQLSQVTPSVDPTTWPANQIGFASSGSGSLQAGVADHNILNLFGDLYTEFWQDTGSPDLPYAILPASAAQFGLAAPYSIAKFDNSLIGVFQDGMGGYNVSRMAGLGLKKVSTADIDTLLAGYSSIGAARGFAFLDRGHPLYVLSVANVTWVYDGLSNIWTQWTDKNGNAFIGNKYATFQGRQLVTDRNNGNIYRFDENTYTDNGDMIPFEVTSKHIWNDDKYIGISQVQIDCEEGVGTTSGQGSNPVMDLQVSDDGGNSFYSVGYSSLGKVGEYTTRTIWNSLGAARDRVLRLRVTDPVKVVITGARCEMQGAAF